MEFNVVIPMWLSTGVVFLLAASVLYHCIHFVSSFFIKDRIPKYIYEYHEKPTNNGISRFLRVLHYYHAFRYEYDINTESDIDPVVDRIHRRIFTYTTTADSCIYEIKRVYATYRDINQKEQN